ncbi:Cys-tRNA(Pro) deacylase [Marinobacter bryozoorum]|uniref:Cys-tRNA(Pro) deacylase n=1 Tax=Marinobacter bryozoorum TaxID=256324 RepID=UPI002005F28F|nr:Cys-tRNA(Pro) deacylase [Marinobacter bryozoorum]MCK7543664.1 Cys-tRNA(Pro) deacylase [Marinobacter bryozoorum]
MTPAINLLRKQGIAHTLHDYPHDPKSESYGTEAAEKLGLDPEQVFKTLVAETDTGELVVAIVPVSGNLNLKQLAKAAKAKKAAMADKQKVQRTTGYVLGGVSPLGQKKALRTVIDESAQAFDTIHVSAGRRGLEIELAPADLADLTRASFAPIKA